LAAQAQWRLAWPPPTRLSKQRRLRTPISETGFSSFGSNANREDPSLWNRQANEKSAILSFCKTPDFGPQAQNEAPKGVTTWIAVDDISAMWEFKSMEEALRFRVGKTEQSPAEKQFVFVAPKDGEYWFAIQIIGKDGSKFPSTPEGLAADQKVYVNTSGHPIKRSEDADR
jgi:hypothetical protein